MKNKKSVFRIISIVMLMNVILIGLIGCASLFEPVNVNTSLNGVWSRGDIVISFSGSDGVFTQINSGHWRNAQNGGLIKIGDKKFRNITSMGNLRWSAQELSIIASDQDVNDHTRYRVDTWDNCTIIMSSNGRTIQIRTQGGALNPDNTYSRVQ